MVALAGCNGGPSIQSKTIVIGLEVETMGNIFASETPMPKLRTGLIFHEGQIIQPKETATIYGDYQDVNLWTASGSMRGTMAISPSENASVDSGIVK